MVLMLLLSEWKLPLGWEATNQLTKKPGSEEKGSERRIESGYLGGHGQREIPFHFFLGFSTEPSQHCLLGRGAWIRGWGVLVMESISCSLLAPSRATEAPKY